MIEVEAEHLKQDLKNLWLEAVKHPDMDGPPGAVDFSAMPVAQMMEKASGLLDIPFGDFAEVLKRFTIRDIIEIGKAAYEARGERPE